MPSPSSRPKNRHHYVPCFYLAHFTEEWASGCSPNEAKLGRLQVFDLETGKQRPSKPVNEGCERGFYLIEGAEPLGIEDTFEKIENLLAPLLRDIARFRALPEQPERLSELATFVALQRARVPHARRVHQDFHDRFGRIILDVVTHSDAAFDGTMNAIDRETGARPARASRERLRSALPNIRVEATNTTLVREMLEGSDIVADMLQRRRWTLLVVQPGVPDFITGDNPVSLLPLRTEMTYPLSFGFTDTAVFYPLTPRVALYGTFNDRAPDVLNPQPEQVAAMNLATLLSTSRFVWSRRRRVFYRLGRDLRRDLSAFWTQRMVERESEVESPETGE
jgi:hypothetical protein